MVYYKNMSLPDIVTMVKMPDYDLVFHIKAFRQLSEDEAKTVIDGYLANRKHRIGLKPGTTVMIETVIGFRRGH